MFLRSRDTKWQFRQAPFKVGMEKWRHEGRRTFLLQKEPTCIEVGEEDFKNRLGQLERCLVGGGFVPHSRVGGGQKMGDFFLDA